MNIEVVELIAKANKIIAVTGSGVGAKYPKSLKNIVVSLRLDHGVSIKELIKHIPVSAYSAREWPRQSNNKRNFNKVSVTENNSVNKKIEEVANYKKELALVNFNLKILIVLLTLLIFELLAFHLF